MAIVPEYLDAMRIRLPVDTHYSRIVDSSGRPLYTQYGAQSNFVDDSGNLRRAQRDVTIESDSGRTIATARDSLHIVRFGDPDWPVMWKRRSDGKQFGARPMFVTAFDERTPTAVRNGQIADVDPAAWRLNPHTRELEGAFGVDDVRVRLRLEHGGPGATHRLYRSLLGQASAEYYGTVWEVNDPEAMAFLAAGGEDSSVRYWANDRYIVEYVRRDAWGDAEYIEHDYTTIGGALGSDTVLTAGTYEVTGVINQGNYNLTLDCADGPIYLKVNFVGTTILCGGTGDFSVVNSALTRRAYVTSANDDTIGEIISGSSGAPVRGDYRRAFGSQTVASNVTIRYLEARYAGGSSQSVISTRAPGETVSVDYLWLRDCDCFGSPFCGSFQSIAAASHSWSNVYIDDSNYSVSAAVEGIMLSAPLVTLRNIFIDQRSSNGGQIGLELITGVVTGSTVLIENVVSYGAYRRIDFRGDDGVHNVSVKRCTLRRVSGAGVGIIYASSAGTGTVNITVDDCVAENVDTVAGSIGYENGGGTGTVNMTLNNCVDWNVDTRLTGTIIDNNPLTADPLLRNLPAGVEIDPTCIFPDGFAIGNLLQFRYYGLATYDSIPLDPRFWTATGYRDLGVDPITPGAQYNVLAALLPSGGPEDEGDVLLEQTPDDGDIEIVRGLVTMTPGLDNAAYLSMFGGNQDDPGGDDKTLQWWGNFNETNPSRAYRSETQYLLRSIPATPANLLRIEDAVRRDLVWMIADGVASTVEVSAAIPRVNWVTITITINGDQTLVYTENWQASI